MGGSTPRLLFSRLMSSFATYMNNRLIPPPLSVGSQARCTTPFAIPTGRSITRTPIHTFRIRILRRRRLRVISSITAPGSLCDGLYFFSALLTRNVTKVQRLTAHTSIAIATSRGERIPRLAARLSRDKVHTLKMDATNVFTMMALLILSTAVSLSGLSRYVRMRSTRIAKHVRRARQPRPYGETGPSIFVEPPAGLAAEPAGGNVFPQQRAGAILGIAEAFE